jgi:5'-nucleotidase
MSHVWLVDQDNVLADFDGEIYRRLQARFPEVPLISFENRTHFFLSEEYAEAHREIIKAIKFEKGFILGLPPIEGGLQALRDMLSLGIDVRICTSPFVHCSGHEHSFFEKYEWVERYLGSEWVERIILTRDKTLVKGELLIDDKPEISGVCISEWEHIVFDQPYNRNIKDRRRLVGWRDWQRVLLNQEK